MVEKQLSENIFEHRQSYNATIWPNRDRILKATAGSRIWQLAHMMCWLLCWIEGLHVILRSELDKTCPALRHQQRMGWCPPLLRSWLIPGRSPSYHHPCRVLSPPVMAWTSAWWPKAWYGPILPSACLLSNNILSWTCPPSYWNSGFIALDSKEKTADMSHQEWSGRSFTLIKESACVRSTQWSEHFFSIISMQLFYT